MAADQVTQSGDDARPMILIVNSCVLGLAILAVAMRFVSRQISGSHRGADDWMSVVALVRQLQASKLFHNNIISGPVFRRLLCRSAEHRGTLQFWEAL